MAGVCGLSNRSFQLTGSVRQPKREVAKHFQTERGWPDGQDDGTDEKRGLLDDDETRSPALAVAQPAESKHRQDLQNI